MEKIRPSKQSNSKDRVGLLIKNESEFMGANSTVTCVLSEKYDYIKELDFFEDNEINEVLDKVNDMRKKGQDARLIEVSLFEGKVCIDEDMTERYIGMNLIVNIKN